MNAKDYGSEWPLTVDTAKVYNDCGDGRPGVDLIVKGQEFTIDDLASRDDAPDAFLPYWMEDPSQSSGLKDLSPLLNEGRAICD